MGACIGGENWGVLSESCPYTKAKAPLRKVGRELTGTAALPGPANQMESQSGSGPASVYTCRAVEVGGGMAILKR